MVILLKVIFLDFDGVLNSAKYLLGCVDCGMAIDPTRMVLLRRIIDATGAKIVLSTSWREHWSKDLINCDNTGVLINRIFSKYGLHIFDKTPELHERRETEIKSWLDTHSEVESFVVLDDMLLNADYLKGHFVKTSNYFDGLDETDVQKATEILNSTSKRGEPMKKLFVVSDVHGHYTLLKEALDRAGYDKDNEDHLLICCGDYFDRGDENMEVLKFFERVKNKVLLRGNHEDMLLKLLQTGKLLPHHYINGTISTLRNIFGKYSIDPVNDTIDFSGKTRIVDRICEFIEETVDYYETEKYVFVHGWLPEDALTPEGRQEASPEAWEKARWVKWNERYIGLRPLSDKILVCGHVPTFYANALDPSRDKNSYEIFSGNGIIAIDAGTADTKQVNVLVLEDMG